MQGLPPSILPPFWKYCTSFCTEELPPNPSVFSLFWGFGFLPLPEHRSKIIYLLFCPSLCPWLPSCCCPRPCPARTPRPAPPPSRALCVIRGVNQLDCCLHRFELNILVPTPSSKGENLTIFEFDGIAITSSEHFFPSGIEACVFRC